MQLSYNSLYQIHYRKHLLMFLLIVIIVVNIILSFKIKAYSSYKTYGIYLDNHLYVDIPINNSDAVKRSSFIKIDDHKYDLEIEEISDLQVEGILNYQTYSLKSFKEYRNNEVVEITFYYDKQRIIQKIIHIIF